MKYVIKYPGLQNSLYHFKIQVLQSIDYMNKVLPDSVQTPENIYNWLKLRTTYVHDGDNEIFQTAQTLFENNIHGLSGAGDCDCFSIAALAALSSRGYKNIGIVLVGRTPKNAVHIYVYCKTEGKTQILDLTNKNFNFERYYPFKQFIPFKVTPIKIIFKN